MAARVDGRFGEKALFVSESESDSELPSQPVDEGWLGVDSE